MTVGGKESVQPWFFSFADLVRAYVNSTNGADDEQAAKTFSSMLSAGGITVGARSASQRVSTSAVEVCENREFQQNQEKWKIFVGKIVESDSNARIFPAFSSPKKISGNQLAVFFGQEKVAKIRAFYSGSNIFATNLFHVSCFC